MFDEKIFSILRKNFKIFEIFFFDFFHIWPHPGVKQAKNDHFWRFQSDPSTRKKVMAKKVKKCLRKIFAKTFFHFFAHNFFPSARIALKLSETAFFGVFYPWMRSKVEKIEKSFAKKNLVRKNVLEKISKFLNFFFSIFFTFDLIQG